MSDDRHEAGNDAADEDNDLVYEAMERALLVHLDEDDAMTALQVLRPWLVARSQAATTLGRLIRHGVHALHDGDGDQHTRDAVLANLDQLLSRVSPEARPARTPEPGRTENG